jgi:hypothetical protein
LETNFISQYQYIAEVPRVKMALAPAPRLAPVTVANTELRVPSERADAIGSEHGAEQDHRNPGQLDRQDRPDAAATLRSSQPTHSRLRARGHPAADSCRIYPARAIHPPPSTRLPSGA